jgi:hypothetical protein
VRCGRPAFIRCWVWAAVREGHAQRCVMSMTRAMRPMPKDVVDKCEHTYYVRPNVLSIGPDHARVVRPGWGVVSTLWRVHIASPNV